LITVAVALFNPCAKVTAAATAAPARVESLGEAS